MIELLHKIEKSLADILYRNAGNIKTMYIDYHKPYVSRIWFIDTETNCRVFLHKIEPCTESKEALYHPHPWDSAMRIVKGEYEMGVGHSETNEIPKTDCKLILRAGACYEMTEKHGWHYVSPVNGCAYTLMITPNKLNGREAPIEPKKTFRKLTSKEVEDMFYVFSEEYGGFSVEMADMVEDVEDKDLFIPGPNEEDIKKNDVPFTEKHQEIYEELKVIKDNTVVEVKSDPEPVFKRGDKVNFKGDANFAPMKGTYVWAVNEHMMLMYYIEHPDGNITKESIARNGGLPDGFETPHSKNFKEGLKYICVTGNQLEKAE